MNGIRNFFTQIRLTYAEVSKNWIVSVGTRFTLLFVVLSFGLIGWRWNILPPAVPLWYSRPWGTEQLASPIWLLALPIGSFFWFALNFFLVMHHREHYHVFTQVLFLTSFLVGFFSFITLVQILFLVS